MRQLVVRATGVGVRVQSAPPPWTGRVTALEPGHRAGLCRSRASRGRTFLLVRLVGQQARGGNSQRVGEPDEVGPARSTLTSAVVDDGARPYATRKAEVVVAQTGTGLLGAEPPTKGGADLRLTGCVIQHTRNVRAADALRLLSYFPCATRFRLRPGCSRGSR